MPRRSGGGSRGSSRAPSRPSTAPQRPAATPSQQQSRGASTAVGRPAGAQPPAGQQQQGKQPGLFGQMASTAAGVAVGSSIGHAVGGWFGGGSSTTEERPVEDSLAPLNDSSTYQSSAYGPRSCDADAKQFTKCLDEQSGNMQICGWYLEQLVRCSDSAATSEEGKADTEIESLSGGCEPALDQIGRHDHWPGARDYAKHPSEHQHSYTRERDCKL
ncbi:uncharacterized protein KY384_001098 [Bacidia gigantensis]|uniref:uncharacterized protein n=1 Tax=Bacidia gigantensis TaxID=2732470 RepID=UPI001D0563C6|nr:uncharacterized protein KY384_001098 [Bacidia gigantensis]KAG8534254.1 hypothetical protein KY384_001098 [Bacidia gigantensis]